MLCKNMHISLSNISTFEYGAFITMVQLRHLPAINTAYDWEKVQDLHKLRMDKIENANCEE